MKKKLLLGVLAMVMTATTAFGMAACSCQGNNGGAGNSTEGFSSLEESSSEVESESSAEENLSEVESSAEESSSEENSSEVENESSAEVESESSSEESSSEVESSSEESSIEESSSEESSEDSTPVENDSSEVHEHTYEVVDSKAATCTENGYETYACGGCGDSYTQTLIGYGGHDLITEVEREATCTESGKIVTRCQREFCDYEKVTITYGSHNYYIKETQEATCTTDGYVLYACENCDDEYTLTTEASHNYEESGRVAAQVGVAGSITYTCTKCRDSYSIEIPALPEVDKSATVLLIQDNLPWAEDVNTSLLKTLYQRGTVESYNIVNTSALANVTLTDYGVIFIANDQSTSMYNRLENYTDELTAYVNAGGVLIYGACDEGWGGGGSFTGSLPGGVTTGNYYSVYNYIVDELHPIVTGVYTDGRNLYNELLKGNYCSHTYFNASTLPAETKVILQDGNGRPTLVEYPLGQGTVLASGLTWEYFYVRNHYNMVTNYSKYAFDDMLTYAIMLATIEPCEHNYEAGETVAPTCADKGYTEYICTECGRVIHSDYVDATGEHNYRTSLELPPVDYTEQNFVGEIIFQCECGASLTREVNWTVVEEVAGNCQAAGYRNYVYEYVDPNGEMQVGEYTVVGETLPHRYNGMDMPLDGIYTPDEVEQVFGNAANCADLGKGSFTCDMCGNMYLVSVKGECEIYNLVEDTDRYVAPTCLQAGRRVYYCQVCGRETVERLDQLAHDLNRVEVFMDGDMLKVRFCCDLDWNCTEEYITDVFNWTLVDEVVPTCREEGYRNYVYEYVDLNGEMQVGEYTVVDETLPHIYNGYHMAHGEDMLMLSWDYALQIFDMNGDGRITEDEGFEWLGNAPMDCQSEGMGVFRCDTCWELYVITIMGDHNWEEIETVPPSSCAERGYTVYGCTECGAETMEFLPTTGLHSYNGYEIDIGAEYSWDDVIEIFGEEMEGLRFFSGTPTFCAETSDAVFECDVCGSLISITVIGPHEYSDGNCIYCGEPDPNVPQENYTEGLVFRPLDDHTCAVNAYTGTATKVVIPSVYNGKAVTSIDNYAFEVCVSLTEIVIPDSVTSIGNSAFYECDSLTEVVIPDSVTSIGGWVFSGCSNLMQIVIPDSVTSIGNGAFAGCTSLTEIVIPDSVTSIGDCTFDLCYSLMRVTFGENSQLTSIGEGVFNACDSLTEIVIPDSVTSIGEYAFRDCNSLTKIVISDGVTSIDYGAFFGCSSLTGILVAENNTEYKSIDGNLYSKDGTMLIQYAIGKTATSFTIPDSVMSIGDDAFWFCDSLTKIVISESVTNIGSGTFADCTSLTEIVIPDSVTSIGSYAFYGCSSLTEIVIPDGVTSIGEGAFACCDNLTIYCEAESQPEGWSSWWNLDNRPVVWGYSEEVDDEETIEFLGDGSVNFGKYPQTRITDSATTSALTSLAGALPTVNAGGWTSYGYYISNSNATDYMWYQDVEYGDSKYRGVYFSSYRPYYTTSSSSTGNSYQDDNGYTTSTLYWFEYEWLNWTILEENDREYFLLCNSIIDSQEYYDNYNTRTINGKTVYANNYAESNIRKWLNETFYETAFNEMQQNLIQTTLVDNSAKSTNPYGQETYWNSGVNSYACEDTNDKIFLLSKEEVTNSNYGFDSNPGAYGVGSTRIKQTSDYAQIQGAYTYSGGSYDGNGYWWLRSPDCYNDNRAMYVISDGCAYDYRYVNYRYLGVVPALKLVL